MARSGLASCGIVAAVLLLAGCGGSRVVSDTPSTAYSPLEFSAAAGGRDLMTEVVGNPFGMDRAAFGTSVTDLMQNQHFGPATRFTTTPGDSADPRYKVVMVFNPAENVANPQICGGRPIATDDRPGQPIRLQAAFCRGGTLTSTNGWAPALSSPQDPAFRSLISDATFSLFPVRDPNRGGDDCRLAGC
ncbi:hypothetical protein IGS68_09530 [Skermanella sp. TT6]|uniref:Lipoprotein n=1 Tax=Skermanella cutis TaxID=2775420 RepID=A0ABX7BAJ5_9PROT|nr:hypothetical protein [Skermanella sp. TT6]QQP91420.1 hypothetical protein IGS68_09530 [Skermanella sp. TT6]